MGSGTNTPYSNTPTLQSYEVHSQLAQRIRRIRSAPPAKLAKLLTMAGLEVESLTPLRSRKANVRTGCLRSP